jgi:signal recognition particle subunit SEC65
MKIEKLLGHLEEVHQWVTENMVVPNTVQEDAYSSQRLETVTRELEEAKKEEKNTNKLISTYRSTGRDVPKDIKDENSSWKNIKKELEQEKYEIEQLFSSSHEMIDNANRLKTKLNLIKNDIQKYINTMPQIRPVGGRPATPKKLKVTLPGNEAICDGTAVSTFLKTMQYIGLEKAASLKHITARRHPLVSTYDPDVGEIREINGFYIQVNTSTLQKANFLKRYAEELNVDIHVEIIE